MKRDSEFYQVELKKREENPQNLFDFIMFGLKHHLSL